MGEMADYHLQAISMHLETIANQITKIAMSLEEIEKQKQE
jgi:hypothetical protein